MSSTARPPRTRRPFLRTYTQDLTSDGVHRLFTREAPEAYRFFARSIDQQSLASLPVHRRGLAHVRQLFLVFSLRLSPARRLLFAAAFLCAGLGTLELFLGFDVVLVPGGFPSLPVPVPVWREGTVALLLGFALLNVLIMMEVADRLSLKNDLEVARDIQAAMLRHDTYRAPGVEAFGLTQPANTVGGDFYEILPMPDGRLVIALGDVAGKGSPAALLMALLLAILRTLVDEGLEPSDLLTRLNGQIAKHAPASRFITLFFAVYDPVAGRLEYVNAGQTPPLLLRGEPAGFERLTTGGIAIGMDPRTTYRSLERTFAPGDVLVLYSDGVTDAESPAGAPFDEEGLERVIEARRDATAPDLCAAVLGAVSSHARDTRFADDLTIVTLRRLPPVPLVAG